MSKISRGADTSKFVTSEKLERTKEELKHNRPHIEEGIGSVQEARAKRPSLFSGIKREIGERIEEKREELRAYPERVKERRVAYKEAHHKAGIEAAKARGRAEAREKEAKGGFFKPRLVASGSGFRVARPKPTQSMWESAPARISQPRQERATIQEGFGFNADSVNIFASRPQKREGWGASNKDIEFVPPKMDFGIRQPSDLNIFKKRKGKFGGFV